MSDNEIKFSESNTLEIRLINGKDAPRYSADIKKLSIDTLVITEKGTEGDLPIVDLQLTDADGNKFFACVTGRIFLSSAEVIQGVNLRNHGSTNP
ncbi:MAG: hypothetical protein K0U20_08880 [Proteobacteria bacterium]|nr:hypothetical protein [Pseudomonadota bacterium]